MKDEEARFIRRHARLGRAPLVPELELYLAEQPLPLWQASEEWFASPAPPPYWAFAWPGGQALARYLLDHREEVAGLRVLDFAAGSGLAALAAARAGAFSAEASDLDPLARCAITLNAEANALSLSRLSQDLVGTAARWDLVVAGDICYERTPSERIFVWLRALAGAGVRVLLGDPGRNYLPRQGLVALARYRVPTSYELEDREERETTVWRVLP